MPRQLVLYLAKTPPKNFPPKSRSNPSKRLFSSQQLNKFRRLRSSRKF